MIFEADLTLGSETQPPSHLVQMAHLLAAAPAALGAVRPDGEQYLC